MFYQPEKYLIPSRRRNTKRIQLNQSKLGDGKDGDLPRLREKLREQRNLLMRDTLDVKDINGARKKDSYQSKIKDIMNLHRVKGSEPKFTKPKRYDENNSFDYSDVNISRRVIRKMVQSSLFDHKPYERAKYLDKVSLGNKFISKIDPVDPPSSKTSMSRLDRPRGLYHSIDFNDLNMRKERLNTTIDNDVPKSRLNRLESRRQLSMYSNHLSNSSLSPEGTRSMKEFQAFAPFAGKPSKHDAFDINRNPYHKVQNDVWLNCSLANDKIIQDTLLRGNPLMQKSRHYRSNDPITSNPYRNNN